MQQLPFTPITKSVWIMLAFGKKVILSVAALLKVRRNGLENSGCQLCLGVAVTFHL